MMMAGSATNAVTDLAIPFNRRGLATLAVEECSQGTHNMSVQGSETANDLLLRQRALSRWEGEGGAGPDGPDMATPDEVRLLHVKTSNAEIPHMPDWGGKSRC
jgi:hypothetical protein